MAEIFDKMKVEFVDQDESVQVVANNIRDTGEVPERYVRYEIKAEPAAVDVEGYNLPVIDMSRLLNPEFSEEETAKLGSACEQWGFFQVSVKFLQTIAPFKGADHILLSHCLSFCTMTLYCIYLCDVYTLDFLFCFI
jgi:hypothetical protein